MSITVNVNGRVGDARDPLLPVLDHGFLYGEGVYETLRTYQQDLFLADRHLARLRRSAALMQLDLPMPDADFVAAMRDTMTAARARDGEHEWYVRLLVTRGVGELTYRPSACPVPSVVVLVKPFEPPPPHTFADGIQVSLVSVRRNHPRALNPAIKSNNLLNNALAMQEAYRRGADEAVMLNQEGELTECSQSNLFLVRGGRLLTPPLSAGLLPGITREFVLERAAVLGLAAAEPRLLPADLLSADEAFLTGTTREVTPIVRVDDHVIGAGRPGPVTRRLLADFRASVAGATAARP